MVAISEGPFETFHDDYRKFEENFKIPCPPPGDDSDSEKEEGPEPEGPACGTVARTYQNLHLDYQRTQARRSGGVWECATLRALKQRHTAIDAPGNPIDMRSLTPSTLIFAHPPTHMGCVIISTRALPLGGQTCSTIPQVPCGSLGVLTTHSYRPSLLAIRQ